MRGLVRWCAGTLVVLTAACQTLIGLDDYQIDGSLDQEATAGGAGGAGTSANAGEPAGGEPAGGAPNAGQPAIGGSGGDGSAGEPSLPECTRASDCDDTIDCTIDSCNPSGQCVHEADDSACLPEANECVSCRLGIGCVARPVVVEELLLDPAFDLGEGDWTEDSDSFARLIYADASAHSAPSFAQLGPAPKGVVEEYADLYQYVSIPQGTQSITLSGYYQLSPGTQRPTQDLAVAALYESGTGDYALLWHVWEGINPAQSSWKEFSYTASRDELEALTGGPYTFDLLSYTADTVFRFDSLSLRATVCE